MHTYKLRMNPLKLHRSEHQLVQAVMLSHHLESSGQSPFCIVAFFFYVSRDEG